MKLSPEITKAVRIGAQRRSRSGALIEDYSLSYAGIGLFIGLMLIFGVCALFASGFVVDKNTARIVMKYSTDAEVLFTTHTSGWFAFPLIFAAMIAAFGVTALLIAYSPFAKRAAAQSIMGAETGFGPIGKLTRYFNVSLISKIDETDPEKFLMAYWRRNIMISAKIVAFFLAVSAYVYWLDVNAYKVATERAFIFRPYGTTSEREFTYGDLDRIEAGCRVDYLRGVPTIWLRYELLFKNGNRFDLYSAYTRGSRLAALEKLEFLATGADIPVIHAHQINEKIKLSNSDIETECAKRVIDFYSEPNEKRAFRLLRISERS